MSEPIEISFACNDWRNGEPTGTFDQVNVTGLCGDYIEIECAPTTLGRGEENMLRVGRKIVRYLRYHPWAGNWCWDGYVVEQKECELILDYLKNHRRAHCIGGPCEFYDKFNGLEVQP